MSATSLIITTINTKEAAQELSHSLLTNTPVACVSILENVESLYFWEGKLNKSNELLLLVKVKSESSSQIIKSIEDLHPYEVPEILCFNATQTSHAYQDWIDSPKP